MGYWQYFNAHTYPHIHNAANRAIAKNSWQNYFQKFEVLFSRKQQGAIGTD